MMKIRYYSNYLLQNFLKNYNKTFFQENQYKEFLNDMDLEENDADLFFTEFIQNPVGKK